MIASQGAIYWLNSPLEPLFLPVRTIFWPFAPLLTFLVDYFWILIPLASFLPHFWCQSHHFMPDISPQAATASPHGMSKARGAQSTPGLISYHLIRWALLRSTMWPYITRLCGPTSSARFSISIAAPAIAAGSVRKVVMRMSGLAGLCM